MQLDTSPRRLELFLDDGGVLNDNGLRRPEWLRLIPEFMVPRLGGTAEQWVAANESIMPAHWLNLSERMASFETYHDLYRTFAHGWMQKSCPLVGIECPPNDEAVALYAELAVYIAERAVCAIDSAVEAVRALHEAGYVLHMASGTASWELRGILGRMGILELFASLHGPDLVDHVKYGPEFYAKVFADAGVEPADALLVDSDEECRDWAIAAGAHGAWVDEDGKGDARSLRELAEALVRGES